MTCLLAKKSAREFALENSFRGDFSFFLLPVRGFLIWGGLEYRRYRLRGFANQQR